MKHDKYADVTPVENFDWPCDRRDAHHPHQDCEGVGAHPATMAGGSYKAL